MLTIVDTPLGIAPAVPEPRAGGFPADLEAALLPGAPEARARLAQPGALVVTTGQQPGLFGGPLYTVHKALSARALALELERRWNRPVVPVFWLAGDDHDYAEATTSAWIGAEGSLVSAALEPRPADAAQRPMAREPVPQRAAELIAEIGQALPAGPAREAALGWLSRHWRADTTLAGAFGGALAEILAPFGILCFDPTAPAAKRRAAPVVVAAAARAAELDRLLVERSAALEAAGSPPGVKVGDGATLAFLDGPGGRDRLVLDGAGFRTRRGGEALDLAALERIAAAEPERLSANVLLRPVVESALLPTVAYLAGPGELRYLALAEVLYGPLGVGRQRPTPRWSGVLVEPRVTRTMEKLGVTLDELLGPAGAVEQRILRTLVPPDFEAAFADLRAAIDAGYPRLVAVARQIDPTLEKPAASAQGAALGGLAELEKRLLGAQKRRQGELMGQLERARASVRPGGAPQERVLGLASLAGRYGFSVLEPLADHIAAWYRGALEGASSTP